MKKEFKVIADLLPDNTRVLDVGCGDGSLMNLLVEEKNIEVRGLELEKHNVQECIYMRTWVASSTVSTLTRICQANPPSGRSASVAWLRLSRRCAATDRLAAQHRRVHAVDSNGHVQEHLGSDQG